MAPRDLTPTDRRNIARGWVLASNPRELTGQGEQEAEERHDGRLWAPDEYDVGPYGWDPGEDKL